MYSTELVTQGRYVQFSPLDWKVSLEGYATLDLRCDHVYLNIGLGCFNKVTWLWLYT